MSYLARAVAVGTLALGVSAGCGAQKDKDYAGDPVAQIRGNVQTSGSVAPVDAEVALVWSKFTGAGPDTNEVVTTKVRGSFPSRFELDVLTPPPGSILNDLAASGEGANEMPFGIATILALRADQPGKIMDKLLGVAEDHVVVYVPKDVQSSTFTSVIVGGPLVSGFHLMKVVRRTPEEKAQIEACHDALPQETSKLARFLECGRVYDAFVEEPAGFATEVHVKLGTMQDLKFPNYF